MPPMLDENGEPLYLVDRIVGIKEVQKRNRVQTLYKVRWLGASEDEDSWEPYDHLGSAVGLIDVYKASLKDQQPPLTPDAS